jgi:hypothetical protein
VRAQSTEEGTGLVCNTPEEVTQVMTAYDKSRDWNAATVAVNVEKAVCAVVHITYFKGDKVGEITTKDGHFNLVEIVVVGAVTAGGVRPVKPEKQVTIFRPKGQDT